MTQNCVFPPELDDKQLLAHLDGAADEATISHLKSCAYCREKAETLNRLQNRLTNQLYRLTCPPSNELGEYHLHMLPASRMLVVAQHVRECPHCAREIAELEDYLSDQRLPVEASLLGKARVLIARLLGSGELDLAPVAALRGQGKGPLTFAAEGVLIVLDIQTTMEGKMNILGQVAADQQDDWTGALVELRNDSQIIMSTAVDDLGTFRCEGAIPGQHELRITSRNISVVVISNFEVST